MEEFETMTAKKEDPAGVPPTFMYLYSKAGNYLKMGPDTYRKKDYFRMPAGDWSPEILASVRQGMEQIRQFRGWNRENAFEGLGVEGCYALLATLHFELEGQATQELDADTFLDELHLKHRVSGDPITLFNKVPKPVVE